jgi:glutathione synthase
MNIRYLLAADPLDRFQPKFDSSLRMTEELLKRGLKVDYLDWSEIPEGLSATEFQKSIPIREVLEADETKRPFFVLGEKKTRPAQAYSVVLQREDPPVTLKFRYHYELFFGLPILQINRPESVLKYTEHTLPLKFPEYSIPTKIVENTQDLLTVAKQFEPECVFKPDDQCSGFGVEFFKARQLTLEMAETYVTKWGLPVIVQPYRSVIESSGDLRILAINGRILGSVLRVPKKGSRLANLHQGASSVAFDPTPRQLEATRVVTEALCREEIYFVGLDFIGDELSEVNITSPSAMVQINEVMGIRAQVALIDEIEKLRIKGI